MDQRQAGGGAAAATDEDVEGLCGSNDDGEDQERVHQKDRTLDVLEVKSENSEEGQSAERRSRWRREEGDLDEDLCQHTEYGRSQGDRKIVGVREQDAEDRVRWRRMTQYDAPCRGNSEEE